MTDFTCSWRDGLAFSALLHRNRPDLVDWRTARASQPRERLDRVFFVAEREYGVTRLLDPEGNDRLSIQLSPNCLYKKKYKSSRISQLTEIIILLVKGKNCQFVVDQRLVVTLIVICALCKFEVKEYWDMCLCHKFFFIVALSWAAFAVSHLTKTPFTDTILPGFLSFMYARCVIYSSRGFWRSGDVRSFWSRLPDQNRFRSRFVHRNVAPSVVVVIMLSILASCRYI